MPPRKKSNKPATTKKTNNTRGQKKSVTFALPPPTDASTTLPTPVAQPPRPPHQLSVPTPYNPSREYSEAVKEVWALAKAYKTESERIVNEHDGDERLSEDVKEYVDGVVMNVHSGESDTDMAKYNISMRSLEYARKQELAAYLDDPAVKEDLLHIIERVQEENRVQEEELKETEGEEEQVDDNGLEGANASAVVTKHNHEDIDAAHALLGLRRIQEKESKKTNGEEEKADDYRPEGAKANAVVTGHNDDDKNAARLLLGFHYHGGTVQGIEAVPSSTAPEPIEEPKETIEKEQPQNTRKRAPKKEPVTVVEENTRPLRRGRSATVKAVVEKESAATAVAEESATTPTDEREVTKETETKEPRKPLSQIDNGQVDDEPQAGPSAEKVPAAKATAKSRGGKRKRGDEGEELLDPSKGVAKEKKPARPQIPIAECWRMQKKPEEVCTLERAGVAE
ncbi:hypothetical protein BDN72DRAFT_879617 [Pluteus cervinus]|uniref:Uncharacterized protein n=1 Tax=Pluteus cervinus TaxID=181527 RepID=A0ACD3AP83_9AGAR|nr:hypothetical protein BDN72DRAFT_879617 [Pluteus cervinus]